MDEFKPKMLHKVAVFLHPALKQLNCASELEKEEIIQHVRAMVPNDEIEMLEANTNETNGSTHRSHNGLVSFFQDFINRRNENSNEASVSRERSSNEVDNYIRLEIPMVRQQIL